MGYRRLPLKRWNMATVIIGYGYGDDHEWEKPDELNLRLPIGFNSKMIAPIGGPTVYRCSRCRVVFRHYYHDTPDIFEAMKQCDIPDECGKI